MPLKYGINQCTNKEYHADREFISSSGLKMVLKDSKKFNDLYNLGIHEEVAATRQTSYDEGSLTHSLLLEPETVSNDYAMYDGLIKRNNSEDLSKGLNWEEFKAKNNDKTIISKPQRIRVERLVEAFIKCKPAVELLKGGVPEQTLAGELLGLKCKVRCDYINVNKGYIVDIKTTAQGSDLETFKYVCKDFGYFLSAAMYISMFSDYYKKEFDFYFIVLSKLTNTCDIFKMSKDSINLGKHDLLTAINTLKKCRETGNWNSKVKKFESQVDSDYEILEI